MNAPFRTQGNDGPGETIVRTTCPYCGVGCGVLVERGADGSATVRGDPEHPANFGRLCSKGSALADTLSLDGRLLHPEIALGFPPPERGRSGEAGVGVSAGSGGGVPPPALRATSPFQGEEKEGLQGKGRLRRRATWDEALDLIATRFSKTIAEHGPDSVAFYVSGQLLTEDYYVANKLMKGFIGSGNIDTNSRLCMSSSVAGHRRAFGSDTVPGVYEDFEEADLVVLVGSNLAWAHPVLYQRLATAKARRQTKIVTVDPRRTATVEGGDLHLAIQPGGDVALFNGLLDYLWQTGKADRGFVERHTSGLEAALPAAALGGFDKVAAATGLRSSAVRHFYELFAAHDRVVTVYSQGVNQSVSGTDKVNAIINCHLLTGRIGRPGMGPFSVTGQPNAMGGREVGGLANQLAAHMLIEDPAHRRIVKEFWGSPAIAERSGLKAVDLFRAVAEGKVKAIWIMATNPVDSMPEADGVAEALARCPFVVVSDVVSSTDTSRYAHVLLPAAAWGEKDGTVTNSERRISRQRPLRALPGEARPDWWALAEVARRMGFGEAFAYDGPASIFREHAALSGTENGGARDFDIGALADLSDETYRTMRPIQWPVPRESRSRAARPGGRFFGDGRFFTLDRRARFVPTPAAPPAPVDPAYPLTLNTGRIRDQWHTMTRTGRSARLSAHLAEPFVEIHPEDAKAAGVAPARLVEVETPHGRLVARALVTESQRRGAVFVPIHWTGQQASLARVDALVTAATDPVSGQPALKSARARIRPYPANWYSFAVLAERPDPVPADYWAIAAAVGGWRVEMAGLAPPADWARWAAGLLKSGEGGEILSYLDTAAGHHRFVAFAGERLVGAVFVAPEPVQVARTFAADGLSALHPSLAERLQFLAGRPGGDRPDPGPIVCSCFSVGANDIVRAIVNDNCRTVDAVGMALSAGTNCGSCRSEIQKILRQRGAA